LKEKMDKIKEKETELLTLQEECLNEVHGKDGKSKNDTENEPELPDYEEIENELSEFQEYLTNQMNLENSLLSLKNTYDNKVFSRVIMILEKGVNDMKCKIDSIIDDDNEFEESEEELRERLNIEKMNKERLNILKNSHTKLVKEKTEYTQKLQDYKNSHIVLYTEIRLVEILQKEINNKLEENIKLEEKRKTHEHNISLIEKFQAYEKELESYNNWFKKIDIVRDEETECRKQYGSAVELKEKILEAESIALLNIITCINTHSQHYLDAFFPENPISVKLVPFKESKKGKNTVQKPQINLQIEYKSMEATLDMLSQGENSRVVLAFFLALSEIFESPFILMDECTSNLDQELNTIVMDSIKENFEGKLAVVIAHQVVNGMFDNTIDL